MRANIEYKLNDVWYGGGLPPWWLRALVPVYRAGAAIDRWRGLRRQPADLNDACIVVVGNITAGGSGKTPLVIRLCRLLKEAGLRPGVISRGYGRKERGLRLASPASDPGVVGDEPLLIARSAGVPVIVARDRCEAARMLLHKGHNVILSDDGLQHHRLPRQMEVCVVDGGRGFGNGCLIPAGPLREPLERLASVDFIVTNGGETDIPQQLQTTPMTLSAGPLRSMSSGQSWRLSQFAGCRVNAVAGIGNPGRFFSLLRHARITPVEYAFPDHHAFRQSDFAGMDTDLPILMTEKDAVKCQQLDLPNAWYLSVEAVLPRDWERRFVRGIIERLQTGGGTA